MHHREAKITEYHFLYVVQRSSEAISRNDVDVCLHFRKCYQLRVCCNVINCAAQVSNKQVIAVSASTRPR